MLSIDRVQCIALPSASGTSDGLHSRRIHSWWWTSAMLVLEACPRGIPLTRVSKTAASNCNEQKVMQAARVSYCSWFSTRSWSVPLPHVYLCLLSPRHCLTSALPPRPAPPLPSISNIPALPPIIQGLPSTSVGGSEGHCPLPTVSELQELPPHKTLSPAPRSPAQSSSLEGRVAALEQANYSLLEELVRMHSKLRAGQRGGVDERQEELGSLRAQLQQMQEELQGLSSQVLHAAVERQSVEETSRQLRLSIEVTVAFARMLLSLMAA